MSAELFNHLALIGSLSALSVNGAAAYLSPRGPWTKYFVMTAGLAAFYAVAWATLLLGDPDRAVWSQTLTPISTLTFFTVWTGPAILVVLSSRKDYEEDHSHDL